MNDEFYEDEVIEGFYVPAMLKAAWGAQMDVFNETDRICRRHNIPYYADWGTLLAAIRHNGYIPWDDDLDISMRRKDYERFLKYAEEELPRGFKVMNYRNHPGHHFFVARIVGKPRICFEEDHLRRFHGFPYIAGVDLFVLDNVCIDRNKEKLKSKKAEFIITVADNIADGKTTGREAEEQLLQSEAYTGRSIDRNLRGEDLRVFMYSLAEELFCSIPDEESDALVQMMPFGMYGNELFIPKEYYGTGVRLPYMDTSISVPLCYDAVMRVKFGNYMTICRKWSGHDYPFFYGQHEDLLKVLDFTYPSYKAKKEDLFFSVNGEGGLKQALPELRQSLKECAVAAGSRERDAAIKLQSIAVEMGTMIEAVYKEGYGPVPVLEEMCELAYMAYEGEDVAAKLLKCMKEYEEGEEKYILSRHDIVFMPFAPKHWKYMEELYLKYKDDGKYNVFVVPLPYYHKEYDGAFGRRYYDISEYPDSVITEDYETFDLKGMHPEKIVIQNPFDGWNPVMSVPAEFYSDRLKEYTDELVYVPFFVTDDFTKEYGKEYINMDAYVCMPGVIRADRIILPSDILKNTYIDKIMDFTGTAGDEEVRALLDDRIGVLPKLREEDYTYTKPRPASEKKTIVWFTALSFLAQNKDRAIEKIRKTIDVFAADSDRLSVVWVTQRMDRLDLIDAATADDFYSEVKRYKDKGLGEYISDVPLKEAAGFPDRCDAYYGDPSAMALWFYYKKKPVMLMNVDA
ncbi:MAG: LicD family protein [Lachnospiraceae bacterium]|nr:LicD family protein [Lachnospiraceae bacterium]